MIEDLARLSTTGVVMAAYLIVCAVLMLILGYRAIFREHRRIDEANR